MFGKSKEDKKQEKLDSFAEQYGLESLSGDDLEQAKKVSKLLAGSDLAEAGLALSFSAKTSDQLQLTYQRALVQQNWIIMNQLAKMNALLEEIAQK